MEADHPHRRGHLLRGARELAGYIFGSEDHHRSVYNLAGELPIFMLGGRLSGYTASLDRALSAKEADATRAAAQAAEKESPETEGLR